MKKRILIIPIFSILLMMLLAACDDSTHGDNNYTQGEKLKVTQNAFVADSTDTYNEAEADRHNKNEMGVDALISSGKAGTVREGTEVTFEELTPTIDAPGLLKIQLSDGSEWIISNEFVEAADSGN